MSDETPMDLEEILIPLNDVPASSVPNELADQAYDDDTNSVGSAWAPYDSTSADLPPEQEIPLNDVNTVENEETIQDRLVNAAGGVGTSALLGSLELLKIAGGLTLSTTGKLVAPPLKVTQQVILPSIYEAFKDYVQSILPQRVKDWFRILTSSMYHFVTVLTSTEKGTEFRSRVATVSADLVDCISADASRQVVVDGMACAVKLAEAMRTPEFKLLLEQCTVLSTRVVDAAASGPSKQLMKDIKETWWSGIEMASDPATIIALAEVTATLCHTLEMEQALHRRRPLSVKEAAQRRYERNEYTRNVYTDTKLMQDPDTTAEEAIMSGLSVNGEIMDDNNSAGPPANVHFEEGNDGTATAEQDEWEEQWRNAGRDQVDSKYLKDNIKKRSDEKERQRLLRAPSVATPATAPLQQQPMSANTSVRSKESTAVVEDLVVETVTEEKESGPHLQRQDTMRMSNIQGRPLKYDNEQDEKSASALSGPTPTASISTRGGEVVAPTVESAADRFYRNLDEIMAQKRSEVLTDLIDKEDETKGRSWDPTSKSKSLKKTAKAIHRNDGAASRLRMKKKKNAMSITILSTIFLIVATAWFGLGCYGIYAMVRDGRIASFVGRNFGHPRRTNAHQQEIVIRVVREVVHVNGKGEVLGTAADGSPASIDADRVAECVNNALG